MSRVLIWINVTLVAIAVVLGILWWRARGERDVLTRRIAVAADTQAKITAVGEAKAAASVPPTTPAKIAPAAQPSLEPAKTADPEAVDDARIIAARRARQPRMNALSGYDVGCVALHLPPATVAKIKEIVLAAWDSYGPARKDKASADEAHAAIEAITQKMDEQLTALLGPATYDELRAYVQESHVDWTIGTDMWDGGAPMSSDQLHALCLAMVQSNFEPGNQVLTPKAVQIPDPATGLSPQDDTLLTRATAFLSASQVGLLRQSLIDDHRYNAAMRAFSAKQRKLWEAAK